MNILIVSTQFPFPPRSGVTTRIYQLVRQLAARHTVTLLSYARPEDDEGVAALDIGISVTVVRREHRSRIAKRSAQLRSIASLRPFCVQAAYSREMQHALDDLCRRETFDCVQLESSVMAKLSIPPGVKVVVDEHNIEYEIFQRGFAGERSLARKFFNRLEYLRVRRFERDCWRQSDGCVVTSEREAPVLRAYAADTPTAVVPNGVDLEFFAPSDRPVDPHTVVFNGTLDYRPNLDAVQYLVEDVWPLVLRRSPDARLTIVGYASTDDRDRFRRPSVDLTGEVPDVRPYLQRAAVVAVPVRMGGGTRLKVVEGLALGKAIVSTSLGCEGIAVQDGEHLLIADDAEAFAAKVTELFAARALADALGAAGRRLVEREYSWDLAGDRLDALYRQLRAESRSRSDAVSVARAAADAARCTGGA